MKKMQMLFLVELLDENNFNRIASHGTCKATNSKEYDTFSVPDNEITVRVCREI
jgi:hypothetical protein